MKEKTRKLILYIVICSMTLFGLVVILKLNQNRIDENLSKNNISDYLSGIKYEDISNYVTEQPRIVIYVTKGSNNRYFEKDFIRIIKKYNLENEIVYIDIKDQNIIDPIYQNTPELIIYKDGKMTDMVDCSLLKKASDIYKVLTERGIIND